MVSENVLTILSGFLPLPQVSTVNKHFFLNFFILDIGTSWTAVDHIVPPTPLNCVLSWYLLLSAPYVHQICLNLEIFGWIFLPRWHLPFLFCIFFWISNYYFRTAGKMYRSTVLVVYWIRLLISDSTLWTQNLRLQTPDSRLQTPDLYNLYH